MGHPGTSVRRVGLFKNGDFGRQRLHFQCVMLPGACWDLQDTWRLVIVQAARRKQERFHMHWGDVRSNFLRQLLLDGGSVPIAPSVATFATIVGASVPPCDLILIDTVPGDVSKNQFGAALLFYLIIPTRMLL